MSEPPAAEPGRPDPFFKLVTQREAKRLGLEAATPELTYASRADLILKVPPNTSLDGTLFDFFRATNVIEFKSQADQFNLEEYARNQIRTDLQFLANDDKDYHNILNLIVSARRPTSFLEAARKRKIIFQPDANRPWLLRAEVGFQNVAIVICRQLPLEERYYNWLVFAPANTRRWRALVLISLAENRTELLAVAARLRPKEFNKMSSLFEELLQLGRETGDITPEYEEYLRQGGQIGSGRMSDEIAVITIEEILEENPEALPGLLAKINLRERLAGLKPEERLAGLKPEERLAGLKPEDRLAGLKPEDRKKLLELLTQEEKQEQA